MKLNTNRNNIQNNSRQPIVIEWTEYPGSLKDEWPKYDLNWEGGFDDFEWILYTKFEFDLMRIIFDNPMHAILYLKNRYIWGFPMYIMKYHRYDTFKLIRVDHETKKAVNEYPK